VFSYHSLPQRQILKGDVYGSVCQMGTCCDQITEKNQFCYRAQSFATSRILAQKLGLKEGEYTTSFQSRLQTEPWLLPYSDFVIKDLAQKGKKKILVFSPAFVADCLETTIEIGDEYHEIFLQAGGEQLDLVPSLNDDPQWIELLADLAKKS
jgi:protoporphyrin/coproporphyrin ferrochelatase